MKIGVKVEFNDTVADIHRRLTENGVKTTVDSLLAATGASDPNARLGLRAFTIDVLVSEGLDAETAGIFLQRDASSAGTDSSALSVRIANEASIKGLSSFRSNNRWASRGVRDFVSGVLGDNPLRRVYDRVAFTNAWNVERNFTDYCSILGNFKKEFVDRLAKHGPKQIWGDLGAGKGRAMQQLFRRDTMDSDEMEMSAPDKPTLDHALHWRFSPSQQGDQERFAQLKKTQTSLALFNFRNPMGTHLRRLQRAMEHLSPESRLFNFTGDFHRLDMGTKPKMDILTDIVGIGTYSRDFGRYLEQVHELLANGGVLYCGIGLDTKFFLEDVDGRREVGMAEFFAQVPGFDFRGDAPTFSLTKSNDTFVAPKITTDTTMAEDIVSDPVPKREVTVHIN